MESIQEFLVDNYIWLIIIALFIIFTLIGYIANKKSKKVKSNNIQNSNVENNIVANTVPQNSNVENNIVANTVPQTDSVENNVVDNENEDVKPIESLSNNNLDSNQAEDVLEVNNNVDTLITNNDIQEENSKSLDELIKENEPLFDEKVPEQPVEELNLSSDNSDDKEDQDIIISEEDPKK